MKLTLIEELTIDFFKDVLKRTSFFLSNIADFFKKRK